MISTFPHCDMLTAYRVPVVKSSAEQQYWLGQCQLLTDIWPVKL